MKFLAMDTEDNSKGDIYLINFFDGKNHTTFDNKPEAWNFLLNSKVNKIFAHNLEYDLINLTFPRFISQIDFNYVGGRLIFAKLIGTRKKFFDSFNFSFAPLKSLGEAIGLQKLDAGENFNNLEYCRRDTEIVWHYIEQFNRQIKNDFDLSPKTTLAGTSFNIFRRKFDRYKLPGKNTEKEILNAYYGGRCEAFKIGKIENYVFETDINSSYPNVMKKYKYPTGEHIESVQPVTDLYLSEIEVEIKKVDIPVLPARKELLFFPVGKFRTWATSPEIKKARDLGQIKKIEYLKTLNFPETDYVFSEFIDYFYKKRKIAKDQNDGFKSTFYKLILNSCYGRFALTNGLQSFTMSGNVGHSEDIKIEKTDSINYAIPAFVTAYARIELYNLIERVKKAGGVPLYCDTDSVYFTFNKRIDLQNKIAELYKKLNVSNDLGDVSLAVYANAAFFNAKQYLATDINSQLKLKCKGVPKANRQEFFEKGSTSYERPIKLRTFSHSIDKSFPPNYWKSFSIEKRGDYKKRIIIKNGETIPLNFTEG